MIPKKSVKDFLRNNDSFTGHDVQIKVGAFIVKGKYVPDEQ